VALSPEGREPLQPANPHVVFLIVDKSFPFPIISFQSHIDFTNSGEGFQEKRADGTDDQNRITIPYKEFLDFSQRKY
jgi:hypothetical protein